MSTERVRFAPSPTGPFHIGGVRTLLFNWLYAKKKGAKLVLRIEDTDRIRSTQANEDIIIRDIAELGLDYDEGGLRGGPNAPYRQSERFKLYTEYARKLLDRDLAYFCFCTAEELAQKNEAAIKLGRTPVYDGKCAKAPRADSEARIGRGEKASLRFRSPKKSILLKDEVRGEIEFKEGTIGDFLITRSPTEEEKVIDPLIGMPVYNFCCVIDDSLMQMTKVIRGEDHLSNSARQIMLYEALGFKPPEFAHLSMVLGADRQKLSKRNGDAALRDYFNQGYVSDAILNFLLLVGWAPKSATKTAAGHPEIFTRAEMIEVFSIEGLQKASAVFDVEKLRWMNSFYIKNRDLSQLQTEVMKFLENEPYLEKLKSMPKEWVLKALATVRTEAHLLSDFGKLLTPFFDETPELNDESKLILKEEGADRVVSAFQAALEKAPDALTEENVAAIQTEVGTTSGAKGKKLFMPMRVSVSGKSQGIELKHFLPLIGKKSALARVSHILKQL